MKAYLIAGFVIFFALAAQAASCSEIDIETRHVYVDESSTEYFYFDLENNSNRDFEVVNVTAGDTSSRFAASVVSFEDYVRDGDSERIKVRIRAFSVSSDYLGDAYIRVTGEFVGGRDCSYSEIGTEYFDVTIEDTGSDESCSDIEVFARDVEMDEDDVEYADFEIRNDSGTRFYVDGIDIDETSSYVDIDVDDFDSIIYGNDSGDLRLRIESSEVNSDKSVVAEVSVRGHFAGGKSCSYSQTRSDVFEIEIDNDGGTGGFSGGSRCNDLTLDAYNISVEQGETAVESFALENDSSERFYVDFVDVYDNSSEIRAESNGFDNVVRANSVGLVEVSVRAYDDAELGREKAFVRIRGHFQGGSTCELSDEEVFYVDIKAKDAEPEYFPPALPQYSPYCNGFIFNAPAVQEIEGSGTISLKIENNTPYRATIRLFGEGLSIEPVLLSVPQGFKSQDYAISVVAVKDSTLFYEIETYNCMSKKSTVIELKEQEQQAVGQETGSAADELLQGLATGFVALGSGWAALGLLIIAIALIFYIVFALRQTKAEPWQ